MRSYYVFEEYRDKAGTGHEEVFNTKEEAVSFAIMGWNMMCSPDKKSYRNDPSPAFRVYRVTLTDEEYKDYINNDEEFVLSDRNEEDIVDILDPDITVKNYPSNILIFVNSVCTHIDKDFITIEDDYDTEYAIGYILNKVEYRIGRLLTDMEKEMLEKELCLYLI